jgi:N-acetylglutamate synthase/N-acetylornithine aminotransferase
VFDIEADGLLVDEGEVVVEALRLWLAVALALELAVLDGEGVTDSVGVCVVEGNTPSSVKRSARYPSTIVLSSLVSDVLYTITSPKYDCLKSVSLS